MMYDLWIEVKKDNKSEYYNTIGNEKYLIEQNMEKYKNNLYYFHVWDSKLKKYFIVNEFETLEEAKKYCVYVHKIFNKEE